MSRLFKIALWSVYSAISVLFIRSLFVDRTVEIVEIDYMLRRPAPAIQRELMIQKRIVSLFAMKKKLDRMPTDYKYILKWTKAFSYYDTLILKNGQQIFLNNNCTYRNCYLTNNKGLLTDVTYFDAILFDVENNWTPHPLERSQYQKFIFFASESADNFPVCLDKFEDYYNLTWTYKLDSDISNAYFNVLDKNGTIVGPKVSMDWIEPMEPTPEIVKQKIKGKNKTAAWFVSHCNAKSNRRTVVSHLKQALFKYNLDIDIYGLCGKMLCPSDQLEKCLTILEKEYYFYISFENSLAEDYVTEKVLHAVMHYTVPVVYGNANYSRFLPPGSYIDAKQLNATSVAALMNEAVTNPKAYENYFKWHNYYRYAPAGEKGNVCKLCELVNAEPTFTGKKDFRKWWNKDYEDVCRGNAKRNI